MNKNLIKKKFNKCEICNSLSWKIIYQGKIRDGSFGQYLENAFIGECLKCKVQRLSEDNCIPSQYYQSGKYRKKLEQSLENNSAVKEQDGIQKFMLEAVGGLNTLRDLSIIDIGCGAGSLLDMVSGVTKNQIGIEPCKPYYESLQKKGYEVYSDMKSGLEKNSKSLDFALSSQVIEHVDNPIVFLKEIFSFLKPGGQALISTPNRNDIMNSILPEFKEFFYRSQHRWYFDKETLENCAKVSGFKVLETKFIHRYGFANSIYWLRDRIPKGNNPMNKINILADKLWSSYLQDTGQTDNIFCHIMRPV